jgi:hypothetical protein
MLVPKDLFSMQKRTVTIHFELTKYQANQLRALGRTLWPALIFLAMSCAAACCWMAQTGAWSEAMASACWKQLACPAAPAQPEANSHPSD